VSWLWRVRGSQEAEVRSKGRERSGCGCLRQQRRAAVVKWRLAIEGARGAQPRGLGVRFARQPSHARSASTLTSSFLLICRVIQAFFDKLAQAHATISVSSTSWTTRRLKPSYCVSSSIPPLSCSESKSEVLLSIISTYDRLDEAVAAATRMQHQYLTGEGRRGWQRRLPRTSPHSP